MGIVTFALDGRGHPLSFTLCVIWRNSVIRRVQGDIRRCDWLKKPHNLEIQTELMPKREFSSQSQRHISPCTSNHGDIHQVIV